MNRSPRIQIFVLVVLGLYAAAVAPTLRSQKESPVRPDQSRPTAPITIPFELVNRHIVLPVKVNDSQPLSFVLDTGDRYAVINLERAKQLGLKLGDEIKVGGAGASLATGAFVQGSTFTLPGLPGFSQPVQLALPLSPLATQLGQDFDGIIGSEFIKEFVVEIDYQARVIRLHDRDRFIYSGPGESIPVNTRLSGHGAGHPIIEAEVTPVGGQPTKGRFVLDIGAGSALVLHSPFVSSNKLPGPGMKTIKTFGTGTGGNVSGQIGRVAELKIGKYRISNPTAMFSEDRAGAFADANLTGNIGAQISSKFRLFLDYANQRIIFEPNAKFSEPFARSATGLSLRAEGAGYRTFRIHDLLENSPATEAGLQKNDVITAIDGRPAAEFNLTKINEMFERPVSYNLTLKRGEQTLKVQLTPRKLV